MHDRTGSLSHISTALPAGILLRFAADDEAIGKFKASRLLLDAAVGGIDRTLTEKACFDTPGRHLQAAGLSLTLLETAGRLSQVVKRVPPKSMPGLPRFEVETDLSERDQFPKKIGAGFSIGTDIQIRQHAGDLRICSQIKRSRETRTVRWHGAESLCHLERETVTVFRQGKKPRTYNLQNIVLERRTGNPVGFFEFAGGLAESCGLLMTQLDGDGLGDMLAAGEPPFAIKAPRYTLRHDAKAEDVFASALKTASTQIIGNREAAAFGNAEGIKQMRVGLRRLRAIARLFRGSLGPDALQDLIPAAKQYGRVLGHARDWDVFAGTTIPSIMTAATLEEGDKAVLAALSEGAAERRQSAHREVAALAASPEFTVFCLSLTAYLKLSGWRQGCSQDLFLPASVYGARALDKRLRKVMAMGGDLADAPAHARHPLRLELKKIRYALHAFRPLYKKDTRKPYLSALSRLQDEFGLLNDAVVARQMALSASSPAGQGRRYDILRGLGASFVIGWSARRLERQSEAVHEAWLEFSAIEPFWRGRA